MSSFRRASFDVTCCARAGSFQSPGSDASRPSWPARSRLPSTSKELLRGQHAVPQLVEAFGVLAHQATAPWHFLYFLPLPHGHGALRGTLSLITWFAFAVEAFER